MDRVERYLAIMNTHRNEVSEDRRRRERDDLTPVKPRVSVGEVEVALRDEFEYLRGLNIGDSDARDNYSLPTIVVTDLLSVLRGRDVGKAKAYEKKFNDACFDARANLEMPFIYSGGKGTERQEIPGEAVCVPEVA